MKKFISISFLLISFCCLVNTTHATLPTPVQLLPANNATYVSIPVFFDWTDVSGATSYRLQVQDSTGTTVLDIYVNPSQYSDPDLFGNTLYYWRVKAKSSTDSSAFTGFWNFRTGISAPPPPTLIYPANGDTGISVTPLFQWSNVTNATSYHIQLALDPGFGTPVIDIPVWPTNSYQVPTGNPLAHGTLYYWHVSASNSGGSSNYSTTFHFGTVASAPPPPTLTYPGNGASNIPPTLTMKWTNVFAATGYHIQIATDQYFQNKVLDSSYIPVDSVHTILSGNQLYYWHVSSIGQGGEGLFTASWTFTTAAGPPGIPVLLSPPNFATCVPRNPYFDWQDVATATSYRIQVSTDPNFLTTVINTTTASSFYQAGTVLNYFTIYFWRVYATNSSGNGNYSPVWQFRTVPNTPVAPALVSPVNNSTGQPLTPTLQWRSVNTADNYRVQVSPNAGFSTFAVNTVVTDTQYTVQTGALVGGQQYYWRVQVNACTLTGPFSTVWNFTTLATLNCNLKVYLEGFYNGSSQVQDTITVLLANSPSPHALVDSNKAFLSPNGTDTVSFTHVTNGSYYIVVRHRNHLETWSATTQLFTTSSFVNYDFTTGSNKAYGNNMKQVGSVWVLYAGDINQDGAIDINGADADYTIYKSQFGMAGYIPSDLNGDNYVDGYDALILYANFFKSKITPP